MIAQGLSFNSSLSLWERVRVRAFIPSFQSCSPTRGLAGKPLAGFCTTPNGRITVVYGVIVYVIRFKNPSLHR